MYSLWNGSALSYNSCTIGFDHFLDRTKFTVPVESCSAAIFVFEQTNKCWSHFIKQFLSPDSYTHRDVTRCSLSSTSSPPLSLHRPRSPVTGRQRVDRIRSQDWNNGEHQCVIDRRPKALLTVGGNGTVTTLSWSQGDSRTKGNVRVVLTTSYGPCLGRPNTMVQGIFHRKRTIEWILNTNGQVSTRNTNSQYSTHNTN